MSLAKLKVLITAPSLDTTKNVSGISSVVKTIVSNNSFVSYSHFVSGKQDNDATGIVITCIRLLTGYFKLVRQIRKERIELVHLNLPLNLKSILRESVTFMICNLFRLDILIHLHGGRFLMEKPKSKIILSLINFMLRRARKVVVLSVLEKEVVSVNYGIKDLTVLENTVDKVFFSIPRGVYSDSRMRVLFLGRLHESKGLNQVILAIRALLSEKNHSNMEFVFCGAGPLQEVVEQLQKDFKKSVSFLGIVDGSKKLEVLSNSDVFLLPSLHGEGLPMALLESMAAGLVPVVTDDGSMKFLIQDRKNGLMVDKGSIEQIMSSLSFLYKNTNERLNISGNARSYVEQNFNIDDYVLKLNRIYAEAKNFEENDKL